MMIGGLSMHEKDVCLSALVVARNEVERLGPCLQALAWADEMVVVLDRTTDASASVAQAYGARVIAGAWPLESERRQAGQDACRGRWILEVDADEYVSPELAAEIRRTLSARESKGSGPDWWRIPFDNYVGTRLIRYGWGAQFGVGAKAILYRRGAKAWEAQYVHSRVTMQGTCGGALTQTIRHAVDRNLSDMLRRLDSYTTAHAADLREKRAPREGTVGKNIARFLGRFYKCYVLRKGYREGGYGFVIAILTGLYPLVSFLKAHEDDPHGGG